MCLVPSNVTTTSSSAASTRNFRLLVITAPNIEAAQEVRPEAAPWIGGYRGPRFHPREQKRPPRRPRTTPKWANGCSGKNTLRRKANLTLFAMAGQDDDLPFRIELWDDKDSHIEEVIALASDYATARGAFDEAVKRRPGKLITLRQKARVIQKSL